jgi:FAD/FMN-containing dehydrogenase
MFVGASNSPGGITIDLRGLDSMSLEDREGDDGEEPTLMVGTGKKWGEVYEFLEDDGRELTVVGGRDSMIGVGGFVLGGKFQWRISK